jgi:hypothetical protein
MAISPFETVSRDAASVRAQAAGLTINDSVFVAPSEKKSPDNVSESSLISDLSIGDIAGETVIAGAAEAIAGGLRAAEEPDAADAAQMKGPEASAEVITIFEYGAKTGAAALAEPAVAEGITKAEGSAPPAGTVYADGAIGAAGTALTDVVAEMPPIEGTRPIEGAAAHVPGSHAGSGPDLPERILPNGESRIAVPESRVETAEAVGLGPALGAAESADSGIKPEEVMVPDAGEHTETVISQAVRDIEPIEPAKDAEPVADASGRPADESADYESAEQAVLPAGESAAGSLILESEELSASRTEGAAQVENAAAAALQTEDEPVPEVSEIREDAAVAQIVTDDIIETEASLFEQRQKKYLTGRVVTKTILDINGDTLIEEGVRITGEIIDKVRASGRMVQLVMNNRA